METKIAIVEIYDRYNNVHFIHIFGTHETHWIDSDFHKSCNCIHKSVTKTDENCSPEYSIKCPRKHRINKIQH